MQSLQHLFQTWASKHSIYWEPVVADGVHVIFCHLSEVGYFYFSSSETQG